MFSGFLHQGGPPASSQTPRGSTNNRARPSSESQGQDDKDAGTGVAAHTHPKTYCGPEIVVEGVPADSPTRSVEAATFDCDEQNFRLVEMADNEGKTHLSLSKPCTGGSGKSQAKSISKADLAVHESFDDLVEDPIKPLAFKIWEIPAVAYELTQDSKELVVLPQESTDTRDEDNKHNLRVRLGALIFLTVTHSIAIAVIAQYVWWVELAAGAPVAALLVYWSLEATRAGWCIYTAERMDTIPVVFRKGLVGLIFSSAIYTLLYVMIIFVGLMMFIIPGLYALAALSMGPLCIVIEGRNVFSAFQRSLQLTRHHMKTTCLYMVLRAGPVIGLVSAMFIVPNMREEATLALRVIINLVLGVVLGFFSGFASCCDVVYFESMRGRLQKDRDLVKVRASQAKSTAQGLGEGAS